MVENTHGWLNTAFFSECHTDFPTPRAPLLGGGVRMDMLRAMSHLGVKAAHPMLRPDHLAIVRERLAGVIAQDEHLIVREASGRYLAPWREDVLSRVKETDAGAGVVVVFREFVQGQCKGARRLFAQPQQAI